MRAYPGLGQVNFALVSAYFVPAWGHDALRVLTSPYNGFEDRAHALAASYIRDLFDFGLVGLIRTSELLAGVKLVVAAAFVAYLIEVARALVTRREPNRETVDVVLLLALAAVVIWFLPALMHGDPDLIRLQASQFLLLIGAAIVITVERHLEHVAQARLEHFQEKWNPVFRPKMRQSKNPGAVSVSSACETAPAGSAEPPAAQAALVALPPVQAALPR
jgi:uncharacterized protein involved in response to NO